MNTRPPYCHRLLTGAGLFVALALLFSAGCAAPQAQSTVAAQPPEVTAAPSETAPAATQAAGPTAAPRLTAAPVPPTPDTAAEVAAIQRLFGNPALHPVLHGMAALINSPNGDRPAAYFDDDQLRYWVDLATGQVVEVDPQAQQPDWTSPTLPETELRARAEQFILRATPGFASRQAQLAYQAGTKDGVLHFYRWEDHQAKGWISQPPLAQVGVTVSGRVVSYLNTLFLADSLSPGSPPAPAAPGLGSPAAPAATAAYPPASDRPAFIYIVVAGDTCAGIAAKFRTTTDKLLAANALPDCTQIRVGQELFIPRSVPYDIQLYVVQPGDSFASIAAAFGLQTDTLLWSNADRGSTPDNLRPGQALLIPPVDGAIHMVQPGDTLAQVASRYHVTTAVIAHYPANDLPSTSAALLPGSLLVIPGGRLDSPSPSGSGSTPAPLGSIESAEPVNLRAGPSTEYDVVGQLTPGQRRRVVGQAGDWWAITLEDAQTAWVFKGLVVFNADASAAPMAIATRPASAAHPNTLVVVRLDGANSAASYGLLSLDCLTRPGGCAQAPRRSIPVPPSNVLMAAAWSPAGDQFVFQAGVDGAFDIYRVNADGSGLLKLSHQSAVRNNLSWSPDGQYLLYTQTDPNGRGDGIWLMRPDGSEAHAIAAGGFPAWSPDGR